ncbi:ATP-binding protein [Desulfovibrio mangrovi]|uniref:ATP-binding protein n=1 Tax=Desulfovibrio mangrovi TaxID=2976983 RepID=UPI002245855F|nr:ATP-binding protein [Desulfovibrio mangrovi]UZP66397.1 ATP-binding protein [Desulfovibrio mangrovi]
MHSKLPFFKRLAVKQGLVILALALALGFTSSSYIVIREADCANQRLLNEVHSLQKALTASAALTSYNYDYDEARAIVESLLELPIVFSASIANETGEQLADAQKPSPTEPISPLTHFLLNHFFTAGSELSIPLYFKKTNEYVGELSVRTNLSPLAKDLITQHLQLFLYELSRAVILALLLGLVFYQRMTKPILGIATHITRIAPQGPTVSPIPIPATHAQDELGNMVRSINELFALFTDSLASKGKLEQRLLLLNTELELRVSERTRELQSQSEALRNEIVSRALAESNLHAHHNLLNNLFEKMKAAIVIFSPIEHDVVEINSVAECMLCLPADMPHECSKLISQIAFASATGTRHALCAYDFDTPQYEEGAVQLANGKSVPAAKYTFHMTVNGQPHVALILMDITEKKTLEHQLGIAQRLESIGLLASGIAHEINTPIQYIHDNMVFLREVHEGQARLNQLYVQLCEKAGKLEELKVVCEEISTATEELDLEFVQQELPRVFGMVFDGIDRVAGIVSAMKRFAHSSPQGMMETDINAALLATVQVAKNEWKYVADVETDLAEDLPFVQCIPGEINQVFLNILINAAHAVKDVSDTTNTRGTITLTSRHEGDKVIVTFSDTGCGIPYDIRDKIFDQFFTTKEPGKGTGQGLAIVHNIVVKKHNGEIKVDSSVGSGTTFTIVLPVSQPKAAEPKKEEEALAASA